MSWKTGGAGRSNARSRKGERSVLISVEHSNGGLPLCERYACEQNYHQYILTSIDIELGVSPFIFLTAFFPSIMVQLVRLLLAFNT